jgi:hypothetical protein
MKMIWIVVMTSACGSVSNETKNDAAVAIDSTIDDVRAIDAFTCATTPSNMTARWRGDGNANDDSGNSYNGTTLGTFAYGPGKHGMAFLFDGSTNAVNINDGDALWPAASFSLELWVKVTTAASATLVQKYQCAYSCPTGSFAFYTLRLGATGHPTFSLRTDATDVAMDATDTTHDLADGSWHHLVGVRDTAAAKMYLYIDGMVAVTLAVPTENNGPMTNTDGETDPVLLGAAVPGGTSTINDRFAGAIDEVAFYKSGLTATQIAQIYAAPEGECP